MKNLHLLYVLALAVSLTACGPDESAPPSANPPDLVVSADFNGRWVGDAVACIPGHGCVTHRDVALILTADGQTLTVSGLCPDGTGAMTATGQHGRSASWSGSVACDYASLGCAKTRDEYIDATMSLDADNTLSLVTRSALSWCGNAFERTTTFTGKK